MGIFVLTPFSCARETCVRAPSTVFPSAKSKSLGLTSIAFTNAILFTVSICNEGTQIGRRTWCVSVKLDASPADEPFVHLDILRFCRNHPCIRGILHAESQDRSQWSSSHPHQVNCWIRTAHQNFLTTRQFKFTQHKSSQATNTLLMCTHRSTWPRREEVFFSKSNTSPLRINKRVPHVASYRHVPDLALFLSPMLSTLLFTVSTFYERLVAESKGHQYRSSRSFIRNSKHLSLFCLLCHP